jgi:two-component system cell cycle sensor histidine kinase/response regulator CckA
MNANHDSTQESAPIDLGLVEAAPFLSVFFRASIDAVFIHDEDGTVIDGNAAAETISGRKKEEWIGRNLADQLALSPEHLTQVQQMLHCSSRREAVPPTELIVSRSDGKQIDVEASAFPVQFKDRTVIVTVIRDISAPKAAERAEIENDKRVSDAEEALRQCERRFMDVLNSSSDAILLIDGDKFVECNESTVQMLGYASRKDFLMTHPSELSPPTQPDGRSSGEKADEMMRAALANGSHRFEWMHRRANGEDFPVDVSLTSISYQGKSKLYCLWRDITAQKHSEEALRESRTILHAVLDSITVRVFWKDRDLVYLGCNAPFARDAGFEKPEDIIGKDDHALGWREQAELYRADDRAVIESGDAKPPIEESILTASGDQIHLLTNKVPLRDTDGKIIGVLGTYLDITERKRAEGLLKAQFDFMQKLIDTIPSPIYYMDDQGHQLGVNLAYERAMGVKRKDILNSSSPLLTTGMPELTSMYSEALNALKGEMKVQVFETPVVYGDGTTHTIIFHEAVFRDADDLVGGILGVMDDVTEQRETMMALAESEQKFRTTFEHSVDALFLMTDTIIDCNKGACGLLECSKVDVIGQPPLALFPEKQPNGRLSKEIVAEHIQLALSGTPQQNTMRCARRDGREFDAEISLSAISLEGRMVLHAIVRDISERLRAEADIRRLATVVTQSAEGVVVTDTDGTIEYVNPAFEKMTQYLAHEVIGQNPRVLKSGKHDDQFYRSMWETLRVGHTWHGQLINKRKDGTLYTEKTTISPVVDDAGVCTHFVALKRDISHEVATEQMLVQSQKMEAIGRLAGGVAHDFNNLLTVITGYSEMILRSLKDDPRMRSDVEEIKKAAERATSLTRQLLLFSRKQITQCQNVNVNKLVSDMSKMLKRLIGEDVELQVEQSVEHAVVHADPGQLEQIVMNLVVNARDAMPKGGTLCISISLIQFGQDQHFGKFELPAGRFVALRVRDSGTGMTDETLSHIFEPFFTTKGIGKGTGLGLATVYGIVQRCDGGIDAKSEIGFGTTITIYLPHSETGKEISKESGQSLPILGHGETIMLVEDDPQVRGFVYRMLTDLNYKVINCENPFDTINQSLDQSVNFDLLLTDVIMPRMNGLQLVEHVRASRPDVHVLLMSGYTDKVVSEEDLARLRASFINKPFRREQLGTKLQQILTASKEQ